MPETDPILFELQRLRADVDELIRGEFASQLTLLSNILTSTSYDGNDTIAVGTVTIDTSAVFGAPVGIKAVLLFVRASWAVASGSSQLQLRQVGGGLAYDQLTADTINAQSCNSIVKCDSNGDFDIAVANANAINVTIRILGYWL